MKPHLPAPKGTRAAGGLALGVFTASSAAILIRLAQQGLPSLAVAAWRLTLAAAALAPLVLLTRRAELRQLSRRDWISLTFSGVLLAVHFGAWISSLAYTSVAASAVLVATSPIFVAIGSHVILRERLSGAMALGLVIAIVGASVIGLADIGQSHGANRLLGNLLAVAGAITVAGYLLIGRRLRARLSLLAYVFPVYSIAAAALMLALLFTPLPRVPDRPITWLWLVLMALGPQIVGHSALNWALRYLSAPIVAVATLAEPIFSTLLAWWVLFEPPSLAVALGGGLTLIGIGLASLAEKRALRGGAPEGQPAEA
ncbi:MAG: DMT family transporter [Anaerolineales bacterium]|nr:DMT family transporter [Anaerolineales bacterium]